MSTYTWKVSFAIQASDTDWMPDTSVVLAAEDGQEAVDLVRAREMGQEWDDCDKDGKPITTTGFLLLGLTRKDLLAT